MHTKGDSLEANIIVMRAYPIFSCMQQQHFVKRNLNG
jgi:hypothetical protein